MHVQKFKEFAIKFWISLKIILWDTFGMRQNRQVKLNVRFNIQLTVSQHWLDAGVSGVDDEDKEESNTGGDERGEEEVEDGPEGDHTTHLGIEAGRARDEAGDDEREDHQLEESHEELSRVGDQTDGRWI